MKISFRFQRNDVIAVDFHDGLIPIIQKNPECFDEIALFTDMNEHCYENIKSIEDVAEILADKISQLKNAGVKSVGLNILNTIGQGDDAWDWVEHSPYQTMIGHDGGTCYGSICMRAEGFYEYMCKKYEVYAKTGADFIWVDDDLRMNWHSVRFPCFCHTCVSEFNKLHGTKYNRESLVSALENDPDGKLRYNWMRFNADEMCRLLKGCADSVYKVNKNIKLGLMTTDYSLQLYNLLNLDEMMEALQADMLRPGAGFWTAQDPKSLFSKCRNVSSQIYQAKRGSDIQYESENIPHLESKPQKIHSVEMTAALMSGCNGIAIDQAMLTELKYLEKMVGLVKDNRKMWEWITNKTENMLICGGAAVYTEDSLAKGDTFFTSPICDALGGERAFFDAGFCFTPDFENANYFVLFGAMVDALSDEKITDILKKSVVIDDLALKKLIDRGFGKYCGAKKVTAYTNGIKEVYINHSFNTAAEGMERGGKQAQFRGGKSMYIPDTIDENAEALSVCKSITNVYCGVGSYIFENELGGRVAALCYVANELYEQEERVDLLRNIIKWLSYDREDFNITGAYNIMPILRKSPENDDFCLMLTNTWLDDSSDAIIKLKTNYDGNLKVYSSHTREYYEISGENVNGTYSFELLPIKAWEFVIISTM